MYILGEKFSYRQVSSNGSLVQNWDLTLVIVYLMLQEIFNIGLCLLDAKYYF